MQQDTSQNAIYEFTDEFAEFPGGPNGMKVYITNSVNYPKAAIRNNIQGVVYVRFMVSDKGVVSNVKITKGIPKCPECSQEVLRVYQSMPEWNPAMENGKPINSYYNSKVTFRIHEPDVKEKKERRNTWFWGE